MSKAGRLRNIETLRGIACVLLVYYHVVGPLNGGLKVQLGESHRIIADAMTYVRMPLFTFVSGYIFSFHYERISGYGAFVLGKARRLLLPLIFAGIPISLLQAVAPGTNKQVSVNEALLSFVYPINHFWFLQSIFVIFCIAGLFARFFPRIKLKYLAFVIFPSAGAFLISADLPRWLGISGAAYLLPFFIIGVFTPHFDKLRSDPVSFQFAAPLLILAFILSTQIYLAATARELVVERIGPLSLVIGITSCLAIYFLKLKCRPLEVIGTYSFAIFMFHTLFAVAVRVAMGRAGIEDPNVVVPIAVAAALAGPAAVSWLLMKSPLLSTLVLGEKAQWSKKT